MNAETNGALIVERMDSLLAKKGLTRNDLCKALVLGSGLVSNWKTRGTIPAADIAIKIADFLGVSVRFLVTGENDSLLTNSQKELLELWDSLTENQRELFSVQMRAVAEKKSERAAEVI
jgi:transcriptional regulator with XRE-family HTH domain